MLVLTLDGSTFGKALGEMTTGNVDVFKVNFFGRELVGSTDEVGGGGEEGDGSGGEEEG